MNSTTSRCSQPKSARRLRIIDSQTRVRYENQRETNKLRRKLIDLNVKYTDTIARLTFKRYDIKAQLHEIEHEIRQRGLREKTDQGKNILALFFPCQYFTNSTIVSEGENKNILFFYPNRLGGISLINKIAHKLTYLIEKSIDLITNFFSLKKNESIREKVLDFY